MVEQVEKTVTMCYHCGETCKSEHIHKHEKDFCCSGCLTVFELLSDNGMCNYYAFGEGQGISPDEDKNGSAFTYLDDDSVAGSLIRFRDGQRAHVVFRIPAIHCSSCIWLLENLHSINKNVISSRVNFIRKEATIVYSEPDLKLSELVALMSSIGYEPYISLDNLSDKEKTEKPGNTTMILKIGVAGFVFGNVMMLSFPEYFGLAKYRDQIELGKFFSWLNLILSIPVLLYSASGFFVSAWKAVSHRQLNIDTPVALAIGVTFIRSFYEIVGGTGAGYLDSMTGIVFFMLIGRYFQNKTYETLSFERDYKSYFPVGTSVKTASGFESKPVHILKKGDIIRVRNGEIIPADSVLMSENTHVDYSFITGESAPVRKEKGDMIYAGARQVNGAAELAVLETVSQSYLTQLWNKDEKSVFTPAKSYVDAINEWFTIGVLVLAIIVSGYWYFIDPSKILNAFTAVLIVACPCGLLLTSTFTHGNLLRVFGWRKFYLRNAEVIDKLAHIDTVIFDKTGTITHGNKVEFHGVLNSYERSLVKSLADQSSHPLSRAISAYFTSITPLKINDFKEKSGSGITGTTGNTTVWLGSAEFVGLEGDSGVRTTRVYVSVNNDQLGYFEFENAYRNGLKEVAEELSKSKQLIVLTGDNDSEKQNLRTILGPETQLLFEQKPVDKMEFVRKVQADNRKVLMIGDGLNDAGALNESYVGVAVSDNTNTFSPACDAIIDGSVLRDLPRLLRLALSGRRIIIGIFAFSTVYNIIGLYFAVRGALSPVVAAILMPASSISIVILTTVFVRWAAYRLGFGKADHNHVSH